MKITLALLGVALATAFLSAAEPPPWRELEEAFELRAHQAELEEELALRRLRPLYLARLHDLYEAARTAGDPLVARDLLAEQERFEATHTMPEALSEHREIRALQTRYQDLATDLRRERARKYVGLARRLDRRLEQLERSLTSAGDIDAALAVRAKRNGILEGETYRNMLALAEAEPAAAAGESLSEANAPGIFASVHSSTPVGEVWSDHVMEHAFDGDPATRWQGDKQEGEWLAAEFNRPMDVREIHITWEVAHAKSYQVHVLVNGQWVKIAETHSGKSGLMKHPVGRGGVTGVRIDNMKAGTEWPPSIFEVEIK